MLIALFLWACSMPSPVPAVPVAPATGSTLPVVHVPTVAAAAGDCTQAKNTCASYAPSWSGACPEGQRCIRFKNSCPTAVNLSYQTGCNGDGTKGAPQCDCTAGPVILPGSYVTWTIVDGNYASCLPSWTPACLTAGLAVLATTGAASCTTGVTRIEFTAGNSADPYGKFDSYDLDVEKGFGVPVLFGPEIPCAHDTANHDCRPLVCDSATCPDAYSTPTSGGCPDGRSPQVGCQDTFSGNDSYLVEFCPSPMPKSCQDAAACP